MVNTNEGHHFLQQNQIDQYLNFDDVYVVKYLEIIGLCRDEFTHDSYELHPNQRSYLNNTINHIIQNYKKVLIHAPEEFNYDYESVSQIIDKCVTAGLKVFISSFDCCVNDFLKVKYPNEYGKNVIANSPITLIKNYAGDFNGKHIERNKKLIFLNYNRKINRDEIICYLNKKNELFNPENIITYHNQFTLTEPYRYRRFYKKYASEHGIDFDFLENLKLQPEPVDIHAQVQAQRRAQELHCMSKFNILCEPYFGYSDGSTEFADYHHTLSRKSVYPFLHRNVVFVHENNNLLSTALKNIGFQLFFDNIEDFINNMTDEYYYSDEVQKKMDINESLIKRYSGMNLEYGKTMPEFKQKMIDELSNFFIEN